MISLGDANTLVRILALDHEESLRRMLSGKSTSVGFPDDTEIGKIKRVIASVLSPEINGIVLDGRSYPVCRPVLPPDFPIFVKLEHGWRAVGRESRERLTVLDSVWTVECIADLGAVGIKLMVYYRPDGSPDIRERQHALAQQIGDVCRRWNLQYVLEPIGYPLHPDETGEDVTARERLAARRPMIVLESVREFSQPHYQADLLKIDFPADLRFLRQPGVDTSTGGLYTLAEVEEYCRAITRMCALPWVIMSSGITAEGFIEYLRLAGRAGARGYICGAAIWQDVLDFYPDYSAMADYLCDRGVENLRCMNAALQRARALMAAPPS